MISEVEDMLDPEARHRTYRLRLVPRAYRSTLVETQEIFLDKSIPEIIQAKLARVGLEAEDVSLRLLGSYPPREFVVQYKETDLAFISRLAEHLGISFYFEHGAGRDVMVFSDDPNLLHPIEGAEVVQFRPRGEKNDVHRITLTDRLIPSTYVAQDYNYLTPDLDISGRHEVAGYAGGVIEYGPHTLTAAESTTTARVRAEERKATDDVFSGEADVCRFHAGAAFTLEGHPRLPSTRLLLVEVTHHATQNVLMGGSAEGDRHYTNRFRAVHAADPYRPPRVTPRPRILGVLSGRIEPRTDGAIGPYSTLDDQGRYTVRFFFDPAPLGARPASSLPVRMMQPHAGPNYGFHFPLKPGVEVLVAFTEGDPDRPFVLGTVPNPVTPTPVAQPGYLMNRIQTASGVFMEMKDT